MLQTDPTLYADINQLLELLLWREDWRNEQVDHAETFPETLGFVHFVISQFEKKAIRKAQELVNTYLPADRSLSDELIAERRMED